MAPCSDGNRGAAPSTGRRPLVRALSVGLLLVTVALVTTGIAIRLRRGETDFPVVLAEHLPNGILALAAVAFVVTGAVIVTNQPGNPIGWLSAALGAAMAVLQWSGEVVPGSDPGRWLHDQLDRLCLVGAFSLFTLLLLLFPTAALPSRRWVWLPWTALAADVLAVGGGAFAPHGDGPETPWAFDGRAGDTAVVVEGIGFVTVQVLALMALASVALRYRRADDVRRAQLKWLLAAAGLLLLLLPLGLVVALIPHVGYALWFVLLAGSFAAIPVSIGVAVLRFHLYSVDRVISRTVSYGLLTGGLLLVWVLLVVVPPQQLDPLTRDSPGVVAVVTLALAGLFGVARRRVQTAVDRRFDRVRYDARRTVEAYPRALRTQVDLDEITTGLGGP